MECQWGWRFVELSALQYWMEARLAAMQIQVEAFQTCMNAWQHPSKYAHLLEEMVGWRVHEQTCQLLYHAFAGQAAVLLSQMLASLQILRQEVRQQMNWHNMYSLCDHEWTQSVPMEPPQREAHMQLIEPSATLPECAVNSLRLMAQHTRACCKDAVPLAVWPDVAAYKDEHPDGDMSLIDICEFFTVGHDLLMQADVALGQPFPSDSSQISHQAPTVCYQFGTSKGKRALRLLRDLLLMKLCIGRGPWRYNDLLNALSDLFPTECNGSHEQKHLILKSQLVLSFSKLLHLGRDWEAFQRHAKSTFEDALPAEEMKEIFLGYKLCADDSPDFEVPRSRGPRKARTRHRGNFQHLSLETTHIAQDSDRCTECDE